MASVARARTSGAAFRRCALPPLATLAVLCFLPGCAPGAGEPPRTADAPPSFVDISKTAGIRFRHCSGARGKKFMPETVGSGCAFLDYDGDGLMDLFFVNSTDWPARDARPHYPALYRNRGDGTFEETTRAAGLLMDVYGQGVAVGDYDNDSDPDLFLTNIGPNRLYRNEGNGRFTDVTQDAGLAGRPVDPGGVRWKWSASAAWLDHDRDGDLDLYVANYVKWTPETDPFCGRAGRKEYCAPTNFEGVPSLFYENLGGGRFRDVSDEVGIARHIGKSFGVAVSDYNEDGWPDLAVANDTKENFLFINSAGDRGRRFQERGMEANIALSSAGMPRAGMGIDAADWRNDGRFGLVIGNFSRECLALYQNLGDARFEDRTYPANLGESSLLSLTFGLFFFDFDLDGWQDIFAANGHIDDFIQSKDARIGYEQLALLYRGTPEGRFLEVGQSSGPALAVKRVLRGCARGDIDNDGDPDLAVVWNNRHGEVWENRQGPRDWIGLVLAGKRSNRDGIGALVRVTAGGVTQSAYRRSGGSFLSDHDPRRVFGLGRARRADRIEIRWPSGEVSHYRNVRPGRYYRAVEGAAQPSPLARAATTYSGPSPASSSISHSRLARTFSKR